VTDPRSAQEPEDWEHYFYYKYLEARGPQFLTGTDSHIADMAESDPNGIYFISQEEIFPMWLHAEGVWYRVGGDEMREDEYKYYYGKWSTGEPMLLTSTSMDDVAYLAHLNLKSIIVFGTNEALIPEHTLLERIKH
jgi:hypothetical protein